MKLHLPIALLTAVICAMSFAQGATPTYKVNNGSAEVIVSGDVTGAESGLCKTKGFVGPLNTSGTANTSTITIEEGASAGKVTASGVAGVNITGDKTVNIYGTTESVYGGYADGINNLKTNGDRLMPKAAADENGEYPVISLNVGKTGVVKGDIYGGSWYSSTPIETLSKNCNTADEFNKAVINDGFFAQNEKVEINIDGGEVASVYGGGYRGSVNNTVTITVNGADSKVGPIYGGAISENLGTYGINAFVNSTHIVINDGEVTSSIRGGGLSNRNPKYSGEAPQNIVKGDTLIEINGGKVDFDVMGGGADGIVEGNTTIVLSGGQIVRDVYAGGSSQYLTSEVRGTGKVIIKGEGTEVGGTIYGGARGEGSVNGDHILGFDGTNNATIEKFLGQSQGFNAVEFKGTTETVDYDAVTDAASTTNAFDTLIISGAENETAMLAAEASKTVVTSDQNHDYKNITVNEGGQYDITGGTHKVTGPGVNGAEEVIVVNGSMSIAGESTELQVQGASSQVAIGNGGSLVVDGAAVDMSAAGTIYMGYSKKETGSIVLKDGASFKGGYNNAWLGGGTVDITNSTMEVSNSESGYNYRTLMGLSGNTLQMNVTATDGGDSTFKSAASQLVLNYNDGTNVELVVSGAGATFEQAGTIVTDKSSYSIGTSGKWVKKTINELVTWEENGEKRTEVKQVERWCDFETEGYVASGNGTTDTVTYICAKGTNEFGGTVAAVNDVKATITAKDGGSVVIGSKLTYVGSSYDAQALAGKKIDKLATFNVEDSASSMSFQGMEIYTNAQVNNKGGKFSATNVNVRAGGNLTFNVNTASAVMTAENLTVYKGGTLSFVPPTAAEGTSLAMEAPATTTVTLDSNLVLYAGSTLVLDPGMLVNLGYNDLTIQDGAIIKLSNAATTTLTMTDDVVEALATTLFQTAGTFTALDENGYEKTNGIAYVEFNNATVAISVGNGVANVPEPTTATLSLLALAGLCARRRRK